MSKTEMGSGAAFLKVISSSEKMEIPTTFMLSMKGSLPNSVILRDRHRNIWPVDVGRDGDGWFFDKGWPQFYRGNSVELGDFLVFEYKGLNLFDFKLFGTDGCEKKEIEGSKFKVKEEEMRESEKKETEGSKFRVKEEEMGEFEMKEIEGSKVRYKEVLGEVEDGEEYKDDNDEDYVRQEEEEEEQDDDDDEEFVKDEEEKINRNSKTYGIGTIQTKRTYTKKNAACYGFDIFDKGLAQLPKNPFFISRSRPRSRESQLYIPREVIVDYDLEIPEKLSMVDERGSKWGTTVKEWKDGRLWCIHGWKSLRNVNRIKRDDVCICELLREEGSNKVHSILVHVVPGA